MAEIDKKLKDQLVAQALGKTNLAFENRIEPPVQEEEAVILMSGKNMFGDTIYSYVKLTLQGFNNMCDALVAGQDIKPSDYGEVVAAGRGEPSAELRSEMAVKYKLIDIPKSKPKPRRTPIVPPSFFDED